MHITLLSASPNADGNTAQLVKAFVSGATEAGHSVKIIDVAKLQVQPVNAAVFKALYVDKTNPDTDGEDAIIKEVMQSQGLVIAFPLYYFNIPATLQTVLERFVSHSQQLRAHPITMGVLSTSGSANPWGYQGIDNWMYCFLRYHGWSNAGKVVADGTAAIAPAKEQKDKLQAAFEFGRDFFKTEPACKL